MTTAVYMTNLADFAASGMKDFNVFIMEDFLGAVFFHSLIVPLAAALVRPDRKVVALAGDGGFLMNSQELETAVRGARALGYGGLNVTVPIYQRVSGDQVCWTTLTLGPHTRSRSGRSGWPGGGWCCAQRSCVATRSGAVALIVRSY